jgi:hypothetical protein
MRPEPSWQSVGERAPGRWRDQKNHRSGKRMGGQGKWGSSIWHIWKCRKWVVVIVVHSCLDKSAIHQADYESWVPQTSENEIWIRRSIDQKEMQP